jgi:hypothetical protein
MSLNPEERRKRALEIANELNSDRLLAADLKFNLTQVTVSELVSEQGLSPADHSRFRYNHDNGVFASYRNPYS